MKNFLVNLLVALNVVSLGSVSHAAVQLTGAGATFPNPMYQKWFEAYRKTNPNLEFNYQPIGSGGGIRQIMGGTVNFAGSDAALTDAELENAKKTLQADLIHIPTILGAVVLTYNLENVKTLNLDGPTIADIYLGKITKWNDARIASINKGVNFPDLPITVVSRSEGSGTTFVFTDYLSKISKDWETGPKKGTAVKFPVGLSGKGNDGVSGLVKNMKGAIGYVELIFAVSNSLNYAAVKNSSGQFILPTVDSVSASAQAEIPKDFRASITNSGAKGAYPLSSFTYLLVNPKLEKEKLVALTGFLKWALGEGQKMTKDLHYAPLPKKIQQEALKILGSLDK